MNFGAQIERVHTNKQRALAWTLVWVATSSFGCFANFAGAAGSQEGGLGNKVVVTLSPNKDSNNTVLFGFNREGRAGERVWAVSPVTADGGGEPMRGVCVYQIDVERVTHRPSTTDPKEESAVFVEVADGFTAGSWCIGDRPQMGMLVASFQPVGSAEDSQKQHFEVMFLISPKGGVKHLRIPNGGITTRNWGGRAFAISTSDDGESAAFLPGELYEPIGKAVLGVYWVTRHAIRFIPFSFEGLEMGEFPSGKGRKEYLRMEMGYGGNGEAFFVGVVSVEGKSGWFAFSPKAQQKVIEVNAMLPRCFIPMIVPDAASGSRKGMPNRYLVSAEYPDRVIDQAKAPDWDFIQVSAIEGGEPKNFRIRMLDEAGAHLTPGIPVGFCWLGNSGQDSSAFYASQWWGDTSVWSFRGDRLLELDSAATLYGDNKVSLNPWHSQVVGTSKGDMLWLSPTFRDVFYDQGHGSISFVRLIRDGDKEGQMSIDGKARWIAKSMGRIPAKRYMPESAKWGVEAAESSSEPK